MCGRYLVITEDEIIEMKIILEELNQRFSNFDDFSFPKSGSGSNLEIAPSLTTPVLVFENDAVVPKPMKWGFSRWDGKGSVINARAESVNEKSFFKDAFLNTRCIIPSRGFFEWKKSAFPLAHSIDEQYRSTITLTDQNVESNNDSNVILESNHLSLKHKSLEPAAGKSFASKESSQLDFESVFNAAVPTISVPNKTSNFKIASEKFWIRRADSPLFFMAGIYHLHEGVEEFVILTMPANLQISKVHDRMPVFLEKPQLMPWLKDARVIEELLTNRNSDVPFLLSSLV